MTVNIQRVSSVVRQVVAVAAIVMGCLTQALSSIQLSPAISTALATIGGVILGIEHYVGDPSTGTPTSAPMPPQPPTA